MTFRSNLLYSTTVKSYRAVGKQSPRVVPNGTVLADYNGRFNLTPATDIYNQISSAEYSGTPGTNDIDGDPNFVDQTGPNGTPGRDFLSWAQTINASFTTWEEVVDAMSETLRGVSGAYTGLDVSSAIEYIFTGYRPQNSAFVAAHDDGTIGAVPYAAPLQSNPGGAMKNNVGIGVGL
jgi:hypothetical protein